MTSRWLRTLRVAAGAGLIFAAVCGAVSASAVHVCGTFGSVYYDVTDDGTTATTLLRYTTAPKNFIDSNSYAAIAAPAPGATWGDGVAYAATMQTRNAWMYTQPTDAAWWLHDAGTGVDSWVFQTSSGGSAVNKTLTSAACQDVSGWTTVMPVTVPPSNSHHVCVLYTPPAGGASTFYDIHDDPVGGTVLNRYSSIVPPVLIDTNWFAYMAKPAAPPIMWGDGVAYAATMQTRFAWMYSQPTDAAYWYRNTNTGSDTWVYEVTINGESMNVTLSTDNCVTLVPAGAPSS